MIMGGAGSSSESHNVETPELLLRWAKISKFLVWDGFCMHIEHKFKSVGQGRGITFEV